MSIIKLFIFLNKIMPKIESFFLSWYVSMKLYKMYLEIMFTYESFKPLLKIRANASQIT